MVIKQLNEQAFCFYSNLDSLSMKLNSSQQKLESVNMFIFYFYSKKDFVNFKIKT